MSSKITEAIVFLNGAQISRTETFELKKGMNKVVFTGLPSDMNGKSVTAASDGKCKVLSVTCGTAYAKAADKRIADLYKKMEKLTDELNGMRRIYNVLSEEEELIRKNAQMPAGKIYRSEDMRDAAAFFRERMASLCTEKMTSEKKMERLSGEISDIRREIGISDNERRRSHAEIEAYADGDTVSELTVSYYTGRAGWTPYYDIRVKDVDGPVSIASKATVRQTTGEDWNDVSLVLSTGDPAVGGNAPELMPWYIDFYEPVAIRSRKGRSEFQEFNVLASPSVMKKEILAEECDLACGTEDEKTVRPSENVTSVEYTMRTPCSVPSSDDGRSVDITSYELEAEYVYKSVRKLEKDVFLLASVKQWEHLNIIAGEANIFFDDKFVGTTFIEPRKAEEGLNISLGRDKNIIVTRTRGKDQTAGGMMSQSVKAGREWTLTVKNLRKQKINIVLEDQIPVSVNKSIVVDPVTISGAAH
ncbi:MAG: DUF4139 domain-containing protein, partial [Methanomassiliicoccaceae archaeon]|nr:DUF4139 domain-containing protein [Methanomassiliicoccaceae archaeon]